MFGYHIHTMIGIQTDPGRGAEAAASLSLMPEVLAVYLTSGSYDLLVEAVLPSNEDFLSFLNDRLGAVAGVRRSEAYHVLKVLKRARDWRLPAHPAEFAPGMVASERA